MTNIRKITEFKAGRETLGDIHYTVYYDTGRRVNYYGRNTLPMTVVNFLTDENTVSETVYIDDNYLHCVNSRTTYTPADKPQEAPAAEAEQAAPAADPDAATLAPADAACVWDEDGNTPFEPAEAAMHAATVAGIIRRKGGYRERDILNHPHTIERGTWTTEHKVVEILAATPDPDGYRAGCAVDIVTRSIVG